MTIVRILAQATEQLSCACIENPQLEAEILLAHLLGKERIWLHLHPEFLLEDSLREQYMALVSRRALHEPTAYISGQREFWSLSFRVTRDTLIPRPETELIVEIALGLVRHERWQRPFILDLGTGSGVARRNAERHGVLSRVSLLQADWTGPFRSCEAGIYPPGKAVAGADRGFHLVVSNPPYVADKDRTLLAKEIINNEPERSLFSGKDGDRGYRGI